MLSDVMGPIGGFQQLDSQNLMSDFASYGIIGSLLKCAGLWTAMRSPSCLFLSYNRDTNTCTCKLSADFTQPVSNGSSDVAVFGRQMHLDPGESHAIALAACHASYSWAVH